MSDAWCGLRAEDRDAVRAFARANGRRWKQKLRDAWERACAEMPSDVAGPLLRARSALGPSGLARLTATAPAEALPSPQFGILLYVAACGSCVVAMHLGEVDQAVSALEAGGLIRVTQVDHERVLAVTAAGRRAVSA